MKIVDGENKDKSTHFSELRSGDVFIMGGEVYMKASYARVDYLVSMETGYVHTNQNLQEVTPLPNAKLHLNK